MVNDLFGYRSKPNDYGVNMRSRVLDVQYTISLYYYIWFHCIQYFYDLFITCIGKCTLHVQGQKDSLVLYHYSSNSFHDFESTERYLHLHCRPVSLFTDSNIYALELQ